MDIKTYIASGIIEDYCLGVLPEKESNRVLEQAKLHPEIKQEIDAFMQSLEQYAFNVSAEAATHLKQQTMDILKNLAIEEKQNIEQLPLLNKYTDHKNWLRIVEPVLPDSLNEKMFVHDIRKDDKVSQTVIWTHIDYPDEVHEEVEECFIILRGKCRCYIEDKIVELGPGGFLEIPMFTHHNVEVLGNDPVLAVVQRVKVA